ncbi:MAG: DMT family transporter [Burkholderiales bacterium]
MPLPDSTDDANGRPAVHPYWLLTFTALFWAGNAVAARALSDVIPPMALSLWRWLLALAILLVPAWPALLRERARLCAHWRVLFALGVFGVMAYNALLYTALHTTTATNGLLINAVTPVFIIVAECVLFGVRLSPRRWAGVAAALAGIVAIVTRGDVAALAAFALNRGDLLLLIAAAAWTAYTLFLRRLPAGLDPLAMLATTVGVGVVCLVPFFAWEYAAGARTQWGTAAWLGVAYIGVFPSVIAYLFYNRAVRAVGGQRAGMFLYLIPVFGIALAIVFLGERLAWFHALGMALIFGGIALATIDRPRAAT